MVEFVKKVWGKEQIIVNNDFYCGKILHLRKGFQCSLHYHVFKDETFYILSGEVLMFTCRENDDKGVIRHMYPGDSIHIPYFMSHRFTGLVDSRIIEFSTTHDDHDSFRLTESGPFEKEDWDL
jgi:mannose-6-phosphate isomerase-like protein (cupin superfamily)